MDKEYFDAKWSEAKNFYGMILCGIMVIKKTIKYQIKGKLAKNRIKWDILQKRFSHSKKGLNRFFDN